LLDYAVNLDPAEFPPLEADLLADIKTQTRLAYARIATNAGRTDEALKLYADCEPFSPDRLGVLATWAATTRDLAIKLAEKNPRAALDWLGKFATMPFGLIQERHRFEALKEIVAILPQEFLAEAKEIADRIGHIGQEEGWPLGAIHRAGLYRALIERFSQLGQPEKGLAIYLETSQFPFPILIQAHRIFALASLMGSFLSHGETTTAAHLFVNRPQVDIEFHLAPSPELESLTRSFLAKDKSRSLSVSIVGKTMEESVVAGADAYLAIAEKAAEVAQECLKLEEIERAAAVLISLGKLPIAVSLVIPAFKSVLEFLVNSGETAKATLYADQWIATLPPAEKADFASYFEGLARSGPPKRERDN
jgi:hypothetical protein